MTRTVLSVVLALVLAFAAHAEPTTATTCPVSTDRTSTSDCECDCNCDNEPAPLHSVFYTAADYDVHAEIASSGDTQFSVVTPFFDAAAVWEISFEPVVYGSLDEAANQENAARLAAIEQALRGGTLTRIRFELRDDFNGEPTFLAIVDGALTESLDRAGARNALGSGTAFSGGETLIAVAFVDALGYQGVPMFLSARVQDGAPAPAPAPTAAARFGKLATLQAGQPAPQPQPVYAACAVEGTNCKQNPPDLPCAIYSSALWVTISCPGKQDQKIPWYQMMLNWDFWKTLVCICSFDIKLEPQVQNGTCNWYRPALRPFQPQRCGCT